MKINRAINKFPITSKLFIWMLVYLLIGIGSLPNIIVCLEKDGQINIETNCDSECDIPKDDHQDDCSDCVDVQLWDYNSDIALLVKSKYSDIGFDNIDSEYNLFKIYFHQKFSVFQMKETHQVNFPPFLKNTILLI